MSVAVFDMSSLLNELQKSSTSVGMFQFDSVTVETATAESVFDLKNDDKDRNTMTASNVLCDSVSRKPHRLATAEEFRAWTYSNIFGNPSISTCRSFARMCGLSTRGNEKDLCERICTYMIPFDDAFAKKHHRHSL